ncbi:MAG: glycosyltransferase family 4 protein [Pirellulaceae bacterium]|nr:glycosyltransferase family 4 protein [Pirellulaceae bacterium]
MKKVVYVTDGIAPYVTGGMQAVARRQIMGLAKRGWDVHFLHSFRKSAPVKTDLPGTEHVVSFPYSGGLSRFMPWHYVSELKNYSKLAHQIIQKLRPSIIYSEGPLIFESLRQSVDVPTVFHPHGLDMFQNQMSVGRNLRARILRPIVRYHAKQASLVFSQGGQLTKILKDQIGINNKKISVLPNAIRSSSTNSPKAKNQGKLKCLFVGRNDPKKGFPVLLQALNSLPNIQLDVIGFNGDTHQSINWHGEIRDSNRILQFYQDADFLLLPSYSEGMATVILEAMSVGTPVIGTDVGATSEVVKDNETGFLIEMGNTAALVEAIQKASQLDEHEYFRQSKNCISIIQNRFSEDAVNEQLSQVLIGVAK